MATQGKEKEGFGVRWWAGAGLFLLVYLVVFAPALFSTYGFAEDYWLLASVGYEKDPMFTTVFFEEGRPLAGWLVRVAFSGLDEVGQLSWIRGLGLAGWALGGLLVAAYLWRELRAGMVLSFACAAATVFTSGGLLLGGWATISFYPIAFVLSFAAGWRLMKEGKAAWPEWLLAFALLFLSLCIYQPMTGAVLLPLFLTALRQGLPPLRRALRPVLLYVFTLGVYFLSWKLAIAAGWLSGGRMVRGGSLEDLLGNGIHFFGKVVPALMSGPGYVLYWEFLGWIWLVAMVAWLVFELRRKERFLETAKTVGLGMGLLLLMSAPMVKSGFSPFRTLVVIGALVQVWPVMLLAHARGRIAGAVGCLVVLFFAGLGGLALRESFVDLHAREYAAGREGFLAMESKYRAEPFGPLFVRIPKSPQAMGWPVRTAYEFGNFTCSSDWAWSDFAKQHLAEIYGVSRTDREAFNNLIEVCPVPADFAPGDAYLLDYPAWLGVEARTDPGSSPNMSAWRQYEHTPLGWTRRMNEQWLWHELIGWGQLYGGNPPYPYVWSKWFGQLVVQLGEGGVPLRFFRADGTPLSEEQLRDRIRKRVDSLCHDPAMN